MSKKFKTAFDALDALTLLSISDLPFKAPLGSSVTLHDDGDSLVVSTKGKLTMHLPGYTTLAGCIGGKYNAAALRAVAILDEAGVLSRAQVDAFDSWWAEKKAEETRYRELRELNAMCAKLGYTLRSP